MKKRIFALALVAIAAASCESGDLENEFDNSSTDLSLKVESFTTEPIPGQYIVVYKDDLIIGKSLTDKKVFIAAQTESIASKYALSSEDVMNVYDNAIAGFAAKLSREQFLNLSKDSKVKYIEQDQMIILKRPSSGGGGTPSGPQETPYGITRVGGANNGTGLTAWVIDSGVDTDHPDLNVDASRGYSAFTRGRDSGTDDGNGHGSHVAGTIAALNNGIGVVGVAAGATVVPVKVLGGTGSGSTSGVIAGVNHVANNGQPGDVANMSLGGGISQTLDDAVINASNSSRVNFVLAAGNESDDANNHSPARANGPYIYTISAFDENDRFASFSNYGTPVDYAAPGVRIKSTWKDGGYNTISGTSMAAPHAAGVILLGTKNTSGTVIGDPDGNPDSIISQ
jgi:subtilisin family serine protease